jgi:hypothetical protein
VALGVPGGWGCLALPADRLPPQEAAKEALYRRNLVENEVSGPEAGWGACVVAALSPPASPQLQRLRR